MSAARGGVRYKPQGAKRGHRAVVAEKGSLEEIFSVDALYEPILDDGVSRRSTVGKDPTPGNKRTRMGIVAVTASSTSASPRSSTKPPGADVDDSMLAAVVSILKAAFPASDDAALRQLATHIEENKLRDATPKAFFHGCYFVAMKMKLRPDHALRTLLMEKTGEAQATALLTSLTRLGRSLRDEKSDVFTFCDVMTFRDAEGDDVVQQRHLDSKIIVTRRVDALLSELKTSQLPIVAGESGAGKTVASIRAGREGTVIYLRGGRVSDEAFDLKSGGDRAKRTKRIVDLLTMNVLVALPSKAWPIAECNEVVTLVIDELGGCPNFLRGLCAARADVCARLTRLLKVAAVYVIANACVHHLRSRTDCGDGGGEHKRWLGARHVLHRVSPLPGTRHHPCCEAS